LDKILSRKKNLFDFSKKGDLTVHNQFNGWKSYSFFFSAENSQVFLKNKYLKKQIENPEQRAFENCYAFLYYLEHGQVYYKQAEKSPLIIRPILLFYGLVHLIKACILTINPLYPENTSVLAHGVTTRKRKKQNYQFFHDEIKIQKNGLFTYMSETMFHMEQLEGDKLSMGDLLKMLPELDELFLKLVGGRNFIKLERRDDLFIIPEKLLDQYHMSVNRFRDFLCSKFPEQFLFFEDEPAFTLGNSLFKKTCPVKYHLEDKFFAFPIQKHDFFHFPELLVHYLLLYNLSMIARYETEWWGELTKMMATKDYPFIYTFLDITIAKGPFLIYQYLMG
jgi:hypothetical protein